MPKCLVPNCPNRYRIGGKEKPARTKSFFQIPSANKNPAKWPTAKVWLDFCRIDISTFLFQQHKTICEDHFEPEFIEVIQQKVFPHGFRGQLPKRLKPGSLPTLLPPPGGPLIHDAVPPPIPPPPPRAPPPPPPKPATPPPRQPTPPPPSPEMTEFDDVPLEELEESREMCEKILCEPTSSHRKEVTDLARWPPNIHIEAKDLNPMLTCGICFGYFYKATTITECLHTFCKPCLVQHFYRSLQCPTCEILVHPSDPFSCIKIDSTMQDLVLKIFPERNQEELIRERAFYRSRGLDFPEMSKEPDDETASVTEEPSKMMSIYLDYLGTSPHLPNHLLLGKKFIRIPDVVTVTQIQKFLRHKMKLDNNAQATLFVNLAMLHGSLTIRRVKEIFGKQALTQNKDLMILQFGIIPKGNYFKQGIIMNTKDL